MTSLLCFYTFMLLLDGYTKVITPSGVAEDTAMTYNPLSPISAKRSYLVEITIPNTFAKKQVGDGKQNGEDLFSEEKRIL